MTVQELLCVFGRLRYLELLLGLFVLTYEASLHSQMPELFMSLVAKIAPLCQLILTQLKLIIA